MKDSLHTMYNDGFRNESILNSANRDHGTGKDPETLICMKNKLNIPELN